MTPQATRGPEFPVFNDYGLSARPKSSYFACKTTERPKIEYYP